MPPSTYYAVLLALVLGVGCATPLTPEERKFVGSYERQPFFSLLTPFRFELLKNGRVKGLKPFKIEIRFTDLHKIFPPPLPKWKLAGGELHTTGSIKVFIINPDGSLTAMPRNVTYRPHKVSDPEETTSTTTEKPKPTKSKAAPNLRVRAAIDAAIRKATGKPTGEITKADLEKVTVLYLNNKQLTELPKGLEKLTQLERLTLSNNQLTDVKGLKKLNQLTWLELNGNKLTSVKGLENLTKLTYLDLVNNKLTELPEGLEKLTQLKSLYLHRNPDLTKAQIDELQKALPKCDIRSNPTK